MTAVDTNVLIYAHDFRDRENSVLRSICFSAELCCGQIHIVIERRARRMGIFSLELKFLLGLRGGNVEGNAS